MSKFYFAVADAIMFHGTKGNMKRISKKKTSYDARYFSPKFVEDPAIAILSAIFEKSSDLYDREFLNEFWHSLTFDKKTNCYIYNIYLTEGGLLPLKPIHKEAYENGKFKAVNMRFEIQLLSSNIETIDLEGMRKRYQKETPSNTSTAAPGDNPCKDNPSGNEKAQCKCKCKCKCGDSKESAPSEYSYDDLQLITNFFIAQASKDGKLTVSDLLKRLESFMNKDASEPENK